MLNTIVTHKAFGQGKIIGISDGLISVEFKSGTKFLLYPDSFESFLTTDNVQIQQMALADIERLKLKKEKDIHDVLSKALNPPRSSDHSSGGSRGASSANDRNNVAFKCTFCDGGADANTLGFKGVCSDRMIDYNITEARQVWCRDEECPCMHYKAGKINRKELEAQMGDKDGSNYVCYESQMLLQWHALAGIVHTGERKGKPMKLKNTRCNNLAVLTTRLPNTNETSRFIFAVFMVHENCEGDDWKAGYVAAHPQMRISLSPTEAATMPLWRYHANVNQPDKPRWGTGLFRYFGDEQAAQILKDILALKRGKPGEGVCKEMLDFFCQHNAVDLKTLQDPSGALVLEQLQAD